MWLLSRYRRWRRSVEASQSLYDACGNGSIYAEEVKELLLAGADPNFKVGGCGVTLLHHACKHGAPGIVQCLVDHGADVNAKTSINLETPLQIACQYDSHENTLILIHHGGDVHAVDGKGRTPLHEACGTSFAPIREGIDRSPKIVECLLANGADVEKPDQYGTTPLHMACFFKWLEIVRRLLNHGADVHVTANTGKTPLHLALQHTRGTNLGVVCCLLENGADPGAVSSSGLTPFQATNSYKYPWPMGILVGIWSGISGDAEREVTFSDKLFVEFACTDGVHPEDIPGQHDLLFTDIVFANVPLLPLNNTGTFSSFLSCKTCEVSVRKIDHLSQWLQTRVLTFPTLKCLCRATIRIRLGASLIPNMRSLYESRVLPRALLEYTYLYHEARAVFVGQVGVIDDLFARFTDNSLDCM